MKSVLSRKTFSILDFDEDDYLTETANPKEVYIVEGDKSTFYILDENEEMVEADRYTMSEKNKKLIILSHLHIEAAQVHTASPRSFPAVRS